YVTVTSHRSEFTGHRSVSVVWGKDDGKKEGRVRREWEKETEAKETEIRRGASGTEPRRRTAPNKKEAPAPTPPSPHLVMAKKRPRPPEVLRRVFGDRVRSLGETLLALLSHPLPSPEKCRCRGRGCLVCGGPAFLLRCEDGSDYRRLLNRCFCVISAVAPELTDFQYSGEGAQRLIVRNTLDSLMGTSQSFNNVLCEGYDEEYGRRRTSGVGDGVAGH
ncbi:hypothetical protein Taro_055119, partial [Colocasia esculenta]|nr:hypothetical protein [Colocasia esculenta]